MVSRQRRVWVAVLGERKTRYYWGFRMEDKSARSIRRMRRAWEQALRRLPPHLRSTRTYDKGLENTLLELVHEALGTKRQWPIVFLQTLSPLGAGEYRKPERDITEILSEKARRCLDDTKRTK